MAATSHVSNELTSLRSILLSHSVLSKQAIIDKRLVAAVIDEHHLYDEEGLALVQAFKLLGAESIHWCRTFDLISPSKSNDIHTIDCTYGGLLAGYLSADESVPYHDHILFIDNWNAFILHTAHDHIIYAGPEKFVNKATQRKNYFRDGWLSIIGQAFSDPKLITEYGLQETQGKGVELALGIT